MMTGDVNDEQRQIWQVVGGGDKGGIVVREGREVETPMAPERLSTGALVQQLALEGERLRFQRLTGTGPQEGWASIALKDGKPLMERRPAEVLPKEMSSIGTKFTSAPAGGAPREHFPPVTGRKVRLMAMHGCPGNSNIMKFMCTTLRSMLGNNFEWIYPEGPCSWSPVPGSTDPKSMEQSDFAKRIAGKKPFTAWYDHPEDSDPEGLATGKYNATYQMLRKDTKDYVNITPYLRVEEAIEYLDDFVQREAPIDAVVAFSQAGTMLGIFEDFMRKAGRPVPWRMHILFCGAEIDDPKYQFDEPSPLPSVYVVGGQSDQWCEIGKKCLPLMYTDLMICEHEDGHAMPTTQPLAGEIYGKIVTELRSICGLADQASKTSGTQK